MKVKPDEFDDSCDLSSANINELSELIPTYGQDESDAISDKTVKLRFDKENDPPLRFEKKTLNLQPFITS